MRKIFCTLYILFTMSVLNVYADDYILCDIEVIQRLPHYSSPVKIQKGFDISKDYHINDENGKLFHQMVFDNSIDIQEGEIQGNSVWANNYKIDRFTGRIEGSMSYVPDHNLMLSNENKHYTISGTCQPAENKRF